MGDTDSNIRLIPRMINRETFNKLKFLTEGSQQNKYIHIYVTYVYTSIFLYKIFENENRCNTIKCFLIYKNKLNFCHRYSA